MRLGITLQMALRFCCWLLTISTAGQVVCRADTVAIPCTADTTLHEVFSEANLGASAQVNSGSTQHPGGGGAPLRTRGIFAFDLKDKIPAGAVVTNAQVTVTVIFSPATPPVTCSYGLSRMLKAWGEGAGAGSGGRAALAGEASWKWASRPEAWSTPGGAVGIDFAPNPSATIEIGGEGVYRFESDQLKADLVQWLASPETNFGWMLICGSEEIAQTAKRFGSREGGEAAVLTVGYSISSAGPEFISLERQGTNAVISWRGGNGPLQLQSSATLLPAQWTNAGPVTLQTTMELPIEGKARFFRLVAETTP